MWVYCVCVCDAIKLFILSTRSRPFKYFKTFSDQIKDFYLDAGKNLSCQVSCLHILRKCTFWISNIICLYQQHYHTLCQFGAFDFLMVMFSAFSTMWGLLTHQSIFYCVQKTWLNSHVVLPVSPKTHKSNWHVCIETTFSCDERFNVGALQKEIVGSLNILNPPFVSKEQNLRHIKKKLYFIKK